MACQSCTDSNGVVLVPYYGLAPHNHKFDANGNIIIGSTEFYQPTNYPKNFKPSDENPEHGIWWCEYCGEGKPEEITMQWQDIKQYLPDDKFDYESPTAKLFLVTDGERLDVAFYAKDMKMFGKNGGIYSKVTHWIDIPDLPKKG